MFHGCIYIKNKKSIGAILGANVLKTYKTQGTHNRANDTDGATGGAWQGWSDCGNDEGYICDCDEICVYLNVNNSVLFVFLNCLLSSQLVVWFVNVNAVLLTLTNDHHSKLSFKTQLYKVDVCQNVCTFIFKLQMGIFHYLILTKKYTCIYTSV
jgi:hypothetical protein